jgi:hypothetical protein
VDLLVNYADQLAEGSVSSASDFPVRGVPVRTQMNPVCGRRRATISPFAQRNPGFRFSPVDAVLNIRNARGQSSGEPESRGIMSRKRASVITKSSHRRRM